MWCILLLRMEYHILPLLFQLNIVFIVCVTADKLCSSVAIATVYEVGD